MISVGRISLGLLLQRFPDHKKEIYMLSLCVTGAILILLGLWTTPLGLTLSAFLFGFFMASIGAVAVEVAYILSPADLFPTLYSFSILLSAFGWALGAPIAGRCQDIPPCKNLGRLWFAYTELQGDFTCYNSYLLTLGTLHSQNSAYGRLIYTK